LETQGLITVWDASQIVGGTDWKQAINSHLKTASIILLLVSANFMASNETYNLAKQAVAKNAPPKVYVVPVLLHEVDWEYSDFGTLAPLPDNRKPIGSWPNRNAAYLNVVKGIRGIVAELKASSGSDQPSSPISATNSDLDKEQSMPSTPPDSQNKPFDVFLCHNNKDKAEVKEIAKQLQVQGIVPWLDEWELQPGLPWQRTLEQQIGEIKSTAVFVGASGFGPWQNMELEVFLREFVNRGCPVIPVLLKTAPDKPKLPPFLAGMTWVDFRKQEPDPMKQLIWGVTSKKPDANDSQSTYSQSSLAQGPSTPKTLSFPQRAELVGKLLACACISNRDSRETVLSLLNEQFPGIVNAVSRRTDNRADVMEVVSTCLRHPGSLQELIGIVTYFEGETSVNTQQLRTFMQSTSF
jgi:nucleotide-binding universal stress UspA family protein